MIDDSSLFHAGTYDPAKAREYYLRTRKLKGRRPASSKPTSSRPRSTAVARVKSKKQRRAEIAAQKAALEKRLQHLTDVLAELVAAAKKRNDDNSNVKSKGGGKAPETQIDKADRNQAQKGRKPLTAAQKAAKAKRAKEAYEKEHPDSMSNDIEVLREQIKDIRSRIKKAMADSQSRRNKAGSKDVKSGSKKNNDGPRGR